MKRKLEVSPGNREHAAGNRNTRSKRSWISRSVSLLMFLLAFVFVVQGQNSAKDPGPRTGSPGAGNFIAGLTASQQSYFTDGQTRFQEVESVQNGTNNGLGPTFNSNQCSSCHSQPAVGGTSPVVNPQIAVANLDGATNTIPSFITLNGPVREARFKFVTEPDGRLSNIPDGGVHGLFTITGRSDAAGCQMSQPNFERMIQENNISFRIPTPLFGGGLIETISDDTIMANQNADGESKQSLGVFGTPNRSGNDGSITRFGWKAQNKSLLMFAGEAYNVEMGITNEIFQNERGYPPVPLPKGCLINPTPEDTTNFDVTSTLAVPSDIVAFSNFMRFLDRPAPSCSGPSCSASIQNGRNVFVNVAKCSVCHTPSLTTGTSYVAALSNVPANLFSDLLLHHMGSGLADGVSQGGAGPDQFRSAPLWGLGQRLFFLHDGRTSDLMQAIEDHASSGSEANAVIRNFNGLSESQKQDVLNFLRSL
ncbi:MAG TPA: di-heme oxidoredictase family protein [Candidatus Acidoferrales bacterium]|nr:di-heme oxidoredictase family protein [Candidatus Acidoferrales bacterium]